MSMNPHRHSLFLVRCNDIETSRFDARSPWMIMGVRQDDARINHDEAHRKLATVQLGQWQGRTNMEYLAWNPVTAAIRRENDAPDFIFEVVRAPLMLAGHMKPGQVREMLNHVSHHELKRWDWDQEGVCTYATIPHIPRDHDAARTYFRDAGSFYPQFATDILSNEPTDASLLLPREKITVSADVPEPTPRPSVIHRRINALRHPHRAPEEALAMLALIKRARSGTEPC